MNASDGRELDRSPQVSVSRGTGGGAALSRSSAAMKSVQRTSSPSPAGADQGEPRQRNIT